MKWIVLAGFGLLAGAMPCGAQSADWILKRPASSPMGFYAMAYDSGRQRSVVLASQRGRPRAATWEWDGQSWSEVGNKHAPSSRSGHAVAYHVSRKRTVVFGGSPISSNGGTALADTWEWDGQTWTQLQPTISPPARYDHRMVYDSARQRTVLFGGRNIRTHYTDTWEWDGKTWTKTQPTVSPRSGFSRAMFYDSSRKRTVLFGLMGGTWEWDGKNWKQIQPSWAPWPIQGFSVSYDSARQRVVMFGGVYTSPRKPPVLSSDTWEWDGKSWTKIRTGKSPSPRAHHVSAYDSSRKRTVIFALKGEDTWEWDGKVWTEFKAVRPPARIHAMAYDTVRRRTISVGGLRTTTFTSETWTWDGRNWTQIKPATSPVAPYGHAMAYDSARQRAVLFGGLHSADTWLWDGSNWQQIKPETSPVARLGHKMAYDSARQRVVLFGGSSDLYNRTLFADTWEWDGKNWTKIRSATSPRPRFGHAMAYDATRKRVVMFGGKAGNPLTASNDLWEWDGKTWLQIWPANAPPPRFSHAMAYDASRRRIVVFGGYNGGYFQAFGDTWEWDGKNWTRARPLISPLARGDAVMVYDSWRMQLLLFGGQGCCGSFLDDTWDYGPSTLTTDTPTISNTGNGIQRLTLTADVRLKGKAYWIFGSRTGTSPGLVFGGVHIALNPDLYTDLAIQQTNSINFRNFRGVLDGSGKAGATFYIPSRSLPSLIGVTVHHAYIVFDAQGIQMASNPRPVTMVK